MIIFKEKINGVTHFIATPAKKVMAMADIRKRVIRRFESKSDIIMEHVGKCILWNNSEKTYIHWITEITNFIQDAMSISKTFQLKEKFIKDHLFNALDDGISEASVCLKSIYRKGEQKGYPKCQLEYLDYERFLDAYNQIADRVSRYLADPGFEIDNCRSNIQSILRDVLDKYQR